MIPGVLVSMGQRTITTGEGGMLVSDDDNLVERVLFLQDHGRKPGDVMFFNEAVAYKYKMSSMQAALGLAQIERVEEIVDRKRQIFSWYSEELSGAKGISMNCEPENTKNSFWMVSIILDPVLNFNKETLFGLLEDCGISCRPFFYPLSAIPAYSSTENAQKAKGNNKISYQLSPTAVNLPSGLNMDRKKVVQVCNVLKKIIY